MSRRESRRSLMPLARASLISIRAASSSVSPRNSLGVPSLHPAFSSFLVLASFISFQLRASGGEWASPMFSRAKAVAAAFPLRSSPTGKTAGS